MTLLYVSISKDNTILAEAVPPSIESKVDEIASMTAGCEQVLERLEASEEQQIMYESHDRSFFCLEQSGFVFIAVASGSVQRSQGLSFLQQLSSYFFDTYDPSTIRVSPKCLNSKMKVILQQQMSEFAINETSRFDGIKGDIGQAKERLAECVELLLERGEKLNQLYAEVELLEGATISFTRSSRSLKRSFWKRNMKNIIFAGAAVAITIIIIILACVL